MSAEHNHAPRCCCPTWQVAPDDHDYEPFGGRVEREVCLACPQHGACICDLARSEPLDHKAGPHHEAFCPRFRVAAGPYTEQETTK